MKELLFLLLMGILIGLSFDLHAEDNTREPYPGCDCSSVNVCQNKVCQNNTGKSCDSLDLQSRSAAIFTCYRVHMKQCKNWYGFLQNCSEDAKRIFN